MHLYGLNFFITFVILTVVGYEREGCPKICAFGYKCVTPQKGCELTLWFIILKTIGIFLATIFLTLFLIGLITCFIYGCLPDKIFRRIVHSKFYREQKQILNERQRKLAKIDRGRAPTTISNSISATTGLSTIPTTASSSLIHP